jgi:hypothetical protein
MKSQAPEKRAESVWMCNFCNLYICHDLPAFIEHIKKNHPTEWNNLMKQIFSNHTHLRKIPKRCQECSNLCKTHRDEEEECIDYNRSLPCAICKKDHATNPIKTAVEGVGISEMIICDRCYFEKK